MWVLDILFYQFLQLKIHRSVYWAIIFMTIVQIVMLLPSAIILFRVNYGCAGIQQTDALIKTALIVFSILFLALNFGYYSLSRIRKLRERFFGRSSSMVWIKTLLAVLLFVSFLIFSDDFLRIFIGIPEC